MKWRVLVSAPYLQPVIGEFSELLASHGIEVDVPPVRERLSEAELLPIIERYDGVLAGDDELTARVLERGRRLKVISKWGVGIDSIDRQAAARLNIAVRNTPGAFNDPVADTVMAYVLAFARQIFRLDASMRAGQWQKQMGFSLRDRTLGVIGVGNIGRAVVRRAIGFGLHVLGNDIVEIDEQFITETGIEMVDKDELLRRSDFVSLNCDLNPTSYHLIGRRELELMPPTAYLINTARGPVVGEQALIEALQSGKIAGAALDVFEVEPLPLDSPLRNLDNCFLAPHNAQGCPRAMQYVHERTIANLIQVLEGGQT